jgi:hypothetical protein
MVPTSWSVSNGLVPKYIHSPQSPSLEHWNLCTQPTIWTITCQSVVSFVSYCTKLYLIHTCTIFKASVETFIFASRYFEMSPTIIHVPWDPLTKPKYILITHPNTFKCTKKDYHIVPLHHCLIQRTQTRSPNGTPLHLVDPMYQIPMPTSMTLHIHIRRISFHITSTPWEEHLLCTYYSNTIRGLIHLLLYSHMDLLGGDKGIM